MDIELLRGFIADARQACRDCNAAFALSGSESELVRLQQAARSAAVERQGKVVAHDGGRVYEYRVHGAGYSFREVVSGKEIHFDVAPLEGVPRMRFSAASVLRYLTSIGVMTSPEVVRAELNVFSTASPELKHVAEHGFDYYLWTGE